MSNFQLFRRPPKPCLAAWSLTLLDLYPKMVPIKTAIGAKINPIIIGNITWQLNFFHPTKTDTQFFEENNFL